MKIAISNIAWNKGEDKAVLLLLKKYSIPGIEVAPSKVWDKPTQKPDQSIKEYKHLWERKGIAIAATQSVLFGHPELLIFGSDEKRSQTLLYIKEMIRVSALLGAGVVVFGSPKNRDMLDMKKNDALDIASNFFYEVGEIAKAHNLFFCIEPTPKEYGTNFVNNTTEAIGLVKLVNHPYFRIHLDSGALTLSQENYKKAITTAFPYLKHFHISEKNLLPIGKTPVDHKKIAKILCELQYDRWVSIEMKATRRMGNEKNVEDALKLVSAIYSS